MLHSKIFQIGLFQLHQNKFSTTTYILVKSYPRNIQTSLDVVLVYIQKHLIIYVLFTRNDDSHLL